MKRRVKITGIGPVTAAGIGRERFWQALLEPVSRVRRYEELDEKYGPFAAAYLDDFQAGRYVDSASLAKGSARQTLFAVVGAVLALRDAGVPRADLSAAHCAIVVGSSVPDISGFASAVEAVALHGVERLRTRTLFTSHAAAAPGAVGAALGIVGRAMTLQSSCCAGMDAVGMGARMVAEGEADLAVCGGTESPLHRFPLLEMRETGLTPATDEMPGAVARPFDLWRTVGVVGEGCCMFIVEPEESPREGYSYILGHAYANDEPGRVCSGVAAADRLALAAAGVRPRDVEGLVAWGPGHREIDAAEARSILDVFGPAIRGVAAVSVKGAIAVPLGAASAIDIAVAALAQRHGVFPPTVNWEHPDPECPLNLSARARAIPHEVTLAHAHGLSGVNSSVVLRKC